MKAIILTLLFSSTAFAGKFYPVGKAGASYTYSKQSNCEQVEGQGCYDITGKDLRWHDAVSSQVDDTSKPIMKSNYNVKACDDPVDCGTKMMAEAADYCTAGDWRAYEKNELMPGYSYYCTGITGYEQKTVYNLVENAGNKTLYQAEDAAKATEEANIANVLKAMNQGKRIVALISLRNISKGLTTAQISEITSTYSAINDLLRAGALETAKVEITALVPDGTLILQADKDAILAEINAYLGQ